MTQSTPAPSAIRRGARVTSVTVSDVCVVCCRASSRLPCASVYATRTHCKLPSAPKTAYIRRTRRSLLHVSSTPTIVAHIPATCRLRFSTDVSSNVWVWPRKSWMLQFRVCCLGLRNPWSAQCKRHLVEDMWARRAPRARAACGPCYRRHSLSPSVSSIIHGMHDEMLSRREWHCTCEWHFWRALAAALAKQSISSPPPRSPPPGAHVSWTCRHTCHFTCACVVYIFTNPKRQVKAPPFKHLQKASVLAERAVLTTQGFCGWDRVWD